MPEARGGAVPEARGGAVPEAPGGVLSGRRRDGTPPTPSRDPRVVTAPEDGEVYAYLGPQMRWVQLVLIAAFVLAGASLFVFAAAHPLLWPAFVVLAFNTASVIFAACTGMTRRRVHWRSHQALAATWRPADGRYARIDVFLPTCGESLAILRNTYRNVSKLTWGGRIKFYVLDDAARQGVEFLADEYGFEYIVRPNRGELRKAGNLRYAFEISSGHHIVIFDADFCPRPDFLWHLLPYLDDPQVGVVQSPQTFATAESMNWIQRTAGATQEFFYRWVQPSRDGFGAATCVGTSAVYRRAALDAVGGFAAIEHSEDLHTGRHLQQAGFGIRYVPVVLSRGLCPADLAGFLNQQYRWCMGSLSRLPAPALATPPVRPTLRQRIATLAGVFYYLTTAMNVFMLFIPAIVMVAFYPADVHPAQLVPFLLGLWVYVVLFPLVSRSRWRFEVLRVQMAYSFAHTVAIWHKLIGREKGWVPTSVVGKTNSLARSISMLGVVALGGSLALFWVLVVRDVMEYGLWSFFMLVGFVLAYTYLAIPLLSEFIKILITPRTAAVTVAKSTAVADVEEQSA